MSSKPQILDACVALIQEGGCRALSLDSAARASGLSKPGLMYHFPTKEALMLGVVNRTMERWEEAMLNALGRPLEGASPAQRIWAFVETVFSGSPGAVGFAVFADAVYRPTSTAAWTRRMEPWFHLPEDLPEDERSRLTLARLTADGLWIAQGSGVFGLDEQERSHVLDRLKALVGASLVGPLES